MRKLLHRIAFAAYTISVCLLLIAQLITAQYQSVPGTRAQQRINRTRGKSGRTQDIQKKLHWLQQKQGGAAGVATATQAHVSEQNATTATNVTTRRKVGRTKYHESYRSWLADVKKDYDGHIRPGFGEEPVVVTVGIYVIAFRSVSEVNMDYTMEMYFRQYWVDDRLSFDMSTFGNRREIDLDSEARNMVWTPDTNLVNAVSSINPFEGSMSHLALTRVGSNGRVFESKRVSITADCSMDLQRYPFDEQLCKLIISSYGFRTADIVYRWDTPKGIEMYSTTQLPDYVIKHYNTKAYNASYATGRYSTLEFCFVLRRNAGYCIVQVMFPATVLVTASWTSLWLEDEMSFSDVIAVILALLFLLQSYNNVMPKVSYVKGMDLYLGACLFFVFMSLVKMAIVKYLRKRAQKKDEAANQRRRKSYAEQAADNLRHTLLKANTFEDQRNAEKDQRDSAARGGSIASVETVVESRRASAVPAGSRRPSSVNKSMIRWSTPPTPPTPPSGERSRHSSGTDDIDESKVQKQQEDTAAVSKDPVTHGLMSIFMARLHDVAVKRVHTKAWRRMKNFHYSSQLLLPVAFALFCIFFFFIFPYMEAAPSC